MSEQLTKITFAVTDNLIEEHSNEGTIHEKISRPLLYAIKERLKPEYVELALSHNGTLTLIRKDNYVTVLALAPIMINYLNDCLERGRVYPFLLEVQFPTQLLRRIH